MRIYATEKYYTLNIHNILLRYYRGISVPDLFRLKDTVDVVDVDGSGRQVLLLPTGSGSPIGNKSSASQDVCILFCWTHG